MQHETDNVHRDNPNNLDQIGTDTLQRQLAGLTQLQGHYLMQFVLSLFDDVTDPMEVNQAD